MNKRSLDPEQLMVESFSVSPEEAGGRGTVHAAESGPTNKPGYITCLGYCGPSVEDACQTTCDPILDCLCTGDCNVTEMSCRPIE